MRKIERTMVAISPDVHQPVHMRLRPIRPKHTNQYPTNCLTKTSDLQNANKKPIPSKRIFRSLPSRLGYNGSADDMSQPQRLLLHLASSAALKCLA